MKKIKIVCAIENENVIAEIDNDKESIALIKSLGGKRRVFCFKKWNLSFSNKEELAIILKTLRDHEFLFLNVPHGWPPYAIFQQLKDEGFLDGTCKEIEYDGLEYQE